MTLLSPGPSECEPHHVLWYEDNGAGRTPLVVFDKGMKGPRLPDRMSLAQTGSLHMPDLKLEDSGIYTGQVICKDNSVHNIQYNVTVLEAEFVMTTDPPLPNAAQRHHWSAGACVLMFVLVLICLIFKVQKTPAETDG
ncbi:unnamed protein product [Knipowitschia caucasica]